MASYKDLVNIIFQDATNHSASTNTSDILGVVMPYPWAPIHQDRKVYSRAEFFNTFPEMLGPSLKSTWITRDSDGWNDYFHQYMQVKRFFDNGGKLVEVVVPITSGQKRVRAYGITSAAGDPAKFYIYWKGAGYPPLNVGNNTDCNSVCINIDGTLDNVVVKVQSGKFSSDTTTASFTPIITYETFYGQLSNPSGTKDGVSTYLPNVLKKSAWIACETAKEFNLDPWHASGYVTIQECVLGTTKKCIFGAPASTPTTTGSDFVYGKVDFASIGAVASDWSGTGCTDFIDKFFGDPTLTSATIVIPQCPSTAATDLNLVTAAEKAQTWTAFTGSSNDTTTTIPSTASKFNIPIAGWELAEAFNKKMAINCCGGVAGAYANVADYAHLNQVASARTYGAYSGSLLSQYTFENVLSNHEAGMVTVYNSATGPEIFGVHNAYYSVESQKNSYYATCNVTRVLTRVLRDVLPLYINAIHTDAAANSITRSRLSTNVQNKIDALIATQDLASDSRVWMTDAMNTDELTKGGRELNAILQLHFIGLVEKVFIKVVATDSSVEFSVE